MLRDQNRRSLSRAELQRQHQQMDQVSPEVGSLDEEALAGALAEDLEEGTSLLIDLARATDPRLRDRARSLAARMVVPAARVTGEAVPGGSVRLGPVPGEGVELDLDATLARLADSPHLKADDLRWRGWRRPGRAVILLIDASGSVTGRPLTTAVVTAAALASRCGPDDELGVVAFWSRAVVLRGVRDADRPAAVIDRMLALRGGDTTDLAGGLRAALAQAGLASALRRDVIVLTDGMANEGEDPLPVAAAAAAARARVHVLALSSSEPEALDACTRLADAGGGRLEVLDSATEAPAALARVLQ